MDRERAWSTQRAVEAYRIVLTAMGGSFLQDLAAFLSNLGITWQMMILPGDSSQVVQFFLSSASTSVERASSKVVPTSDKLRSVYGPGCVADRKPDGMYQVAVRQCDSDLTMHYPQSVVHMESVLIIFSSMSEFYFPSDSH